MKKVMKGFLLLFAIVLSVSFIFAGFQTGVVSHSISKQYGPGESVKGWVNISFSNEPANEVFSDSRNN